MSSVKVAEIQQLLVQEDAAAWVSALWDKYNTQRTKIMDLWSEVRDYVFATDTTTTTNKKLPWKNSTTIPKLCQIRDNLHANYRSSLFPNDRWLQWIAYSKDSVSKSKAETIRAYMENKTRMGGFRSEISKLLLDYIDYGNVFATTSFEARYKEDFRGAKVPLFIGPTVERISPMDIVFNPTATSFEKTFKVVRSIKTEGELLKLAKTHPEHAFWEEVVRDKLRKRSLLAGCSLDDIRKAAAYSVDGFGNLQEYLFSEYVEILTFYGDYYDSSTGELHERRMITVANRCMVADDREIPTWTGESPIRHVGWRTRQDNLWAMGPLENLVGMQYRIDHLENLAADAMDLAVDPPLAIKGEVEQFDWAPGAEIHLDENGSIGEIAKSLNGILAAQSKVSELEAKMELMAGAPREAAGIRTPGEKTALEVNMLSNAAGRMFQDKITHFEVNLLEPILNDMLEQAVRNMDTADVIRIIDTDSGVQEFRSITREDISGNGIIRPIGARHFSKQSQDLQNIVGVLGGPVGQLVAPHTSGKALTAFINDVIGLDAYKIFSTNVAIEEAMETQALQAQAQEDLAMAQGPQATPPM